MRSAGDSTAPPRGGRLRSVAATALGAVRAVVNVAVVVLLVMMVALILAQILGRYVFNFSIAWSEEVATFAQIWLVMLGAGVAMRRRQHVGIDMLVVRLPFAVQRVAKTASLLLAVWFLLVVVVGSFGMLGIGLILKSPALQVPMVLPYAALPIGMSYVLLELAIATLPEIRDPALARAAAAEAPE